MFNKNKFKVWLLISIWCLTISIILFLCKSYMYSLITFLMIVPCLGVSLSFLNISKRNLKLISYLVTCFINPLFATLSLTLLILKLKNGILDKTFNSVNIYLFSINFFIIAIFLSIMFKKLNKKKNIFECKEDNSNNTQYRE